MQDSAQPTESPTANRTTGTIKLSTPPENSPAKQQFGRRQQWIMSALMCAMAACMVVEVVAITLDRYERTKQLDQLNVELKQLEIRLQQIQKASDKRDKRDFKEKREPAKAKPDAAGNKSSQLHRLDWPGGRLVDDRLAMPGVSWTGSVLA